MVSRSDQFTPLGQQVTGRVYGQCNDTSLLFAVPHPVQGSGQFVDKQEELQSPMAAHSSVPKDEPADIAFHIK